MEAFPVCQTAEDVARLDGQVVQLTGVYRRRAIERKKKRPRLGPKPRPQAPVPLSNYVSIELAGSASAYDRIAADGEVARIRLGDDARPDDEVGRLTDQRVVAIGRLVVSPPPPEEDVASERPTAILVDVQRVALAE